MKNYNNISKRVLRKLQRWASGTETKYGKGKDFKYTLKR